MSEHTPGPWVAEMAPPAGGIWPANICELGYGIWVREADGIVDDIPSEAESQANARAIAAVPDLLEALQDITELLDTEADILFERRQAIKIAREAIAKASGRAGG